MQKFDSCKINEFFSRFIGTFIVPCQPSELVEPREGSFHDLSERLRRKPVGSLRGRADFDINVEISLDIIYDLPLVSSINKPLRIVGHASATCSQTVDAKWESWVPALLTVRPRMHSLRSTEIVRLMPFTFLLVS